MTEPHNIVPLHRDHLDAAWGFASSDAALIAHSRCQVGVCATLTAAVIQLRNRGWT
ncbi:hypothetical protein OH799_25470 [Nocardia sp. NBC_00881]|uniref:hypothetical protein n=1 Tax=Nocardia sp. NBC_00881 TaxID=2975995 RepID=UPI00386636B2|nr:hypothetical protein OH799_25470 [Nocardia sp. NBC_00881]